MGSKRLWAAFFAIALVVAACGGDDDAGSGSNGDNGQSSQEGSGSDGGDDGEENPSSDGNNASVEGSAFPHGVDEDFPVPVPAGWEIDVFAELAEQGADLSGGGVQLYYSSDEFDQIVAFYDEWFADVPDQSQWVRSEAGGNVIFQRSSPLIQITISKDVEERGELRTFLVIAAASE